jgi:methyl-accepting chemotaxis protein
MFNRFSTKVAFGCTAGTVLGVFLGNFFAGAVLGLNGVGALLVTMSVAALCSMGVSFLLGLSLESSLQEVAQRLQKVAAGQADIDTELEPSDNGLGRDISRSYNAIVRRISMTVHEVTGATNKLAFTTSHLAEVTEKTEKNANKQKSETDQVATAMTEMSSSVDEVAHNATEASVAAQKANDAANNGTNIAGEAKQGIDQLVNNIEGASSVISRLETESVNIGVVLDVIKGIAEQTNLLALNAAIEAARAGEQGRGFAVVADEVRTLASRTQESTQEIETMISQLQQGARDSVSAMSVALDKGKEGSGHVANTLRALEDIQNAVSIINDMNAQIATAAEEQSHVASEINHNIVNISQLADFTTSDAEDSRSTSEQLAQISDQLRQMVGKFGQSKSGSLDLSSAKAAHLNWKTKLRSFLDGQSTLTEAQAVSHRHCDFGKWYYSEGLKHFSNNQAIIAVEKPHEELHKIIKQIIEHKNAGRNQEAEQTYLKVAQLSEQIVSLLDEAENLAR